MIQITKGKVNRPLKVVAYGSEGIGKTTFAAGAPDPLFIDTEGSTVHLDVNRTQKPESWEELLVLIEEVANTPRICKTLVLDTIDWAEQLCVKYVCDKYRQANIESFGFGKGYVILADEFMRLLKALDKVIEAGIHVIITAHAKMRKFEQPDEQGAYDRWELKLSKHTAPLIKEWCDMLLFMNYKTYVFTTETNSKKAQGGKRVIYTSHHPCWDAKNRQDLPEEIPLDFKTIEHLFTDIKVESPMEKLSKRMEEDGISKEVLQAFIAEKGHYKTEVPITDYEDRFITGWILKYWEQIVKQMKEKGDTNNE